MSVALEIAHHDEPVLQFGADHTARSPKEGLIEAGPYDLRLGNAHRTQLRLGLVGPPEAVRAMHAFLGRIARGISAEKDNLALFPNFPGFERVFRSTLAVDAAWDHIIPTDALRRALSRPAREAFIEAVDLWGSGIDELARRELPIDIAICCLPPELRSKCGVVEANLPIGQLRALRKEQKRRDAGQDTLFDVDAPAFRGEPTTLEDAADPQPEDLLSRNFRSALKGRAMEAKLPIQLVTDALWMDQRGSEDPATRAWNLSVALFYKAGGIPWRADMRVDEACFVGISFHHLRTRKSHVVYSSLAQAFSSDGEGFALRGEAVPYDAVRKQPYLTKSKARALLRTVLDAYRDRAGRDPMRIVVHKTTEFTAAEREGIAEALTSVPTVQLLTIRSRHDLRLLRQGGTYPPHRGTLCRLGDASFLFTVGYQSQHLTYPGPHVPVPIEIVGAESEDLDGIADDLLCLTKMNWNSARSAAALPITLSFSRKVGGILAELPPGISPHPSFRYYM
jgi:hypothetical protein